MLIDCDRCVARPAACSDCVVGVLLGTPQVPAAGPEEREPAAPGDPLPAGFGPVERRALDVLADHGLIPRLRLVHVTPDQGGVVSSEGPQAGAPSGTSRRTRDAG